MENASKALIIAGAILLSILIIGLGMLIYDQAMGAIGNTGIDQQKVATENRQFTQYEGKQSGTQVKTMLNSIAQYNINGAEDYTRFVKVVNEDASTITKPNEQEVTASVFNNSNVNNFKTTVKTGLNYNVTIGYDDETGYVVAVGFTQVAAGE